MKMFKFFLLSGVILGGFAAYIQRSNESPERLLDALRLLALENANEVDSSFSDDSRCSWKQYGDDYIPTVQDINQCLTETGTCNAFDVSRCENQECVLGYETDMNGCIVSCDCKQEGLFEGDIMIQKSDVEDLKYEYGLTPLSRAAMKDKNKRWDQNPDGNGLYVVHYQLSQNVATSKKTADAIKAAMQDIEANTCLRFDNKLSKDYIEFIDRQACYSQAVGRRGGKQSISIGRRCARKGYVIHEMFHALGFWHEQSRPDRDKFVIVQEDNIIRKKIGNFRKKTYKQVDSMGSPYDIGSIMHYGGYSFSKNNKPTIIDRKTNKPVKRQRLAMSYEDIKQINLMYKCNQ